MGFIRTTWEIIELLLNNEKTKIINVIMSCKNKRLKAFIFPRWTRLPINYVAHFKNSDKTIKPGSSEMAGLIITVDEDVYEYSTAKNVRESMDYISTSRDDLQFICEHLNQGIKDTEEKFAKEFLFLEKDIDGLWKRGINNGFVKEECMKNIESKSYENGLIVVQYNRGRKHIVSKRKVEKRSKGEELCPYCIQEEGREDYPWNNYIVSANPYPYYDHHIVLVNQKHIYQFIDADEIKVMASFVLNVPSYSVVYNGPPGTSILGHMHFQAGRYFLPVEKAETSVLVSDGNLKVSELVGFFTRGFVVEKLL